MKYDYLVLIRSIGAVILCLLGMAYLLFFRKTTPVKRMGSITYQPPRDRRPKDNQLIKIRQSGQRSGIPNSIQCRTSQRKRREAERRQP